MTDPITQAAAEALATYQHGDSSKWRIFGGSAAVVVAAVTPLIREQIADQIETRAHQRAKDNGSRFGVATAYTPWEDALIAAAHIAKGDAQ